MTQAADRSMPLQPSPSAPQIGGPVGWFLKFFSSIWLGVFLLFLLFVYSSIGSAGMPVHWNLLAPSTWVHLREMRGFEMSEFEWFHWWPFNLLMALICLNLIVATLRRIPFKPVNYGVWMIHAGIIILCVGSVIYFRAKVEGDAPVIRRQVLIEVPGERPVALPAIPGAMTSVGSGSNQYQVMIAQTDPEWELLTEPYKGQRVYSVNVRIASPQREFIRQLIWGHEGLTEDIIRSTNPEQPFQRAKKVLGEDQPLVDRNITLRLAHRPQDSFFLMNSAALYLREEGTREWIQRPIHNLPRYNDYLPSLSDAWLEALPAQEIPPVDPLDIHLSAAADSRDPLPGQDVVVTGYVRYATLESRPVSGGESLNPMVRIQLHSDGAAGADPGAEQFQLLAMESPRNQLHVNRPDGTSMEVVRFVWLKDEAELATMIEVRHPRLSISVPESNVTLTLPIEQFTNADAGLGFTPIEGTPYAWRANYVADNLHLTPMQSASMVSIEIKTPEGTFERWVFDDPALTRDFHPQEKQEGQEPAADPHSQWKEPDSRLVMNYAPGVSPPPVMMVGGPDEQMLRLVSTTREGQAITTAKVGDELPAAPQVTLKVLEFAARTGEKAQPMIVPRAQRDRSMTSNMSMIQARIPVGEGRTETHWLPYHHYAFETINETLRMFPYRPQTVQLADGRRIQVMFARERMALPAPVVLDEFIVREEIGGYQDGNSLSVRDWESRVLFEDPSEPTGWSGVKTVSMNAPAEHEGYWFFQSQWDPPRDAQSEGDLPSKGLNFTVLGVGNREGVHTQLAGCCIAVTGMIYAFYVKPIIKRRKQREALELAAQASRPLEPAAARERALASTMENRS